MKNPLGGMRRLVAGTLKLEVWLLSGREKNSGLPLTVAYATSVSEPKSYFAKTVFAEPPSERSLGGYWLWRIRPEVLRRAPETDLLVCEVNARRAPFFRMRQAFRSPVWVRFELAPEAGKAPRAGHLKFKDMHRKIRKYGYVSRLSRDAADLEQFYRRMYLPSTTLRHGASAVPRSYAELKRVFETTGELLLVEKDGESVAGGIVDYPASGECVLLCHGIRDGSAELLRMGVVDALHYFEFSRAFERKGIRRIDLGHCRAFFGDGVFRHKVELGARVAGHNREAGLLYLRALRMTPQTASFLSAHPLVTVGHDGYRGVVFCQEPPSDAELDGFLDDRACKGLQDFSLYSLSGTTEREVRTPAGRCVRLLRASASPWGD